MSASSRCGVGVPSRKTAVPSPVPRVSTSSSPSPEITASPCMSASFDEPGWLPEPALELSRQRETCPRLDELAGQRGSRPSLRREVGRSEHPAVLGRTLESQPRRDPSGGSWCVSSSSSRMSTRGGHGYGVLVRTRSTIFAPSASRTDAFRPVPPMSIASVIGLADSVAAVPACSLSTPSSCPTQGDGNALTCGSGVPSRRGAS